MDRTREFLSIVEHIEIPQDTFEDPHFFTGIRGMEAGIEAALASLSKLTSYEMFKAQTLLNKAAELLKEYKDTPIEISGASRDCQDILANLRSMINTKYLRYTLKLSEMKRRLARVEPEAQSTAPVSVKSGNASSTMALMEEQDYQQKNDLMEERKRMVKSINEIGQIIEDISIHVKLQEEQLKRVDDIVLESDKWSKKALVELNEIWFSVRSNRKTIIKFFMFWMVILLFFWGLRKI